MTIEEIKELSEKAKKELDRLLEIMASPNRLLGEFYSPYGDNIIEYLTDYFHIQRSAIEEAVIQQLKQFDVLAGCQIERVDSLLIPGNSSKPIMISYKLPLFQLFLVDIKGKRYEGVFESAIRGAEHGVSEAVLEMATAKTNLDSIETMHATIISIMDGDIYLKGFAGAGKKKALKKYLESLNYGSEEIKTALANPEGLIQATRIGMEKSRSTTEGLAMKSREAEQKAIQFQQNVSMQNTTRDFRAILEDANFREVPNLLKLYGLEKNVVEK